VELQSLQVSARGFPPNDFGGMSSKVKKFSRLLCKSFSKNTLKQSGHKYPLEKSGLNSILGSSLIHSKFC
jgi:hypothetical protein